MPWHNRYFELCAGTAQLYYAKVPATVTNYLADINPEIIAYHEQKRQYPAPYLRIVQMDVVQALLNLHHNIGLNSHDFIYLDPPYPASARRSDVKCYPNEMLTDEQHILLLSTIRRLKAKVMISSRQNDLYDRVLHDWRKKELKVRTRVSTETEVIYMNYAPPQLLHQYNYLGVDCWDRQRVKRKIARFAAKIAALPVYEQHVLIQEMIKHDAPAVQHFLTVIDQQK